MDARAGRALERLPRALDIRGTSTRQAGNDRPANRSRNRLYSREITVRCDGKTRLDHVYAQTVELVRQTQLFLHVHAATRRLLAIAQGGIEYRDARSFHAQDLLASELFMLRRRGHKAKLIMLLLSLVIL